MSPQAEGTPVTVRPCIIQPRRPARGVTLIELMVALVVALLLSAAVFGVLKVAEGRKRTLTTVNDINQSGNYALYLIDKWVRSAGSGLVQASSFAYGCPLYAYSSAAGQVLPRTAALPAPFDQVVSRFGASFRLAPVLILPGATTPGVSGQASDALVLMAASSGAASIPLPFASSGGAAATLTLGSTQGLSGSDLLLLADQQGTSTGAAACMVQQVASGFTGGSGTTVPLGGAYYAEVIGAQRLDALTPNAVAMNLGSVSGNLPQFLLVGVGDHNVLHTYDLLQATAEPLQQRAEGVFELHALYGVDLDADGKLSSSEWASPAADAYAPAALAAGTKAANQVLQRIKAVRVGLILRTALPERAGSAQAPAATSATLFADTAWSFTRQFTGDELNYRYRTLELTIPVRNNLLLN